MSVQAKFKVTRIEKFQKTEVTDPKGNKISYTPTNVVLSPVYVSQDERKFGSTENEMFGFYTPNGSIQMSINNDAASNQFSIDQEFYVEFTAVPPEVHFADDDKYLNAK